MPFKLFLDFRLWIIFKCFVRSGKPWCEDCECILAAIQLKGFVGVLINQPLHSGSKCSAKHIILKREKEKRRKGGKEEERKREKEKRRKRKRKKRKKEKN